MSRWRRNPKTDKDPRGRTIYRPNNAPHKFFYTEAKALAYEQGKKAKRPAAKKKAAPKKKAPTRKKNTMGKTRPKHDPYEIWALGDWEWHVLKKYQADDNKPGARWFALVKTPIVPRGEMGDVYAAEVIGAGATRIKGGELERILSPTAKFNSYWKY